MIVGSHGDTPCYQCDRRHEGCHGTCKEYQDYFKLCNSNREEADRYRTVFDFNRDSYYRFLKTKARHALKGMKGVQK